MCYAKSAQPEILTDNMILCYTHSTWFSLNSYNLILHVYTCTTWNLRWRYHCTLDSCNLSEIFADDVIVHYTRITWFPLHSHNLISEVYTCTTWNLYWQYHSTLHSHNLNLTRFGQLDFRGLHLHNLKSLLTISLYTKLAQPDFHRICTTWYQVSTLAQPKILIFTVKVAYFTLYSHTLIFIALAKHDFNGLHFLLCVHVSLKIHISYLHLCLKRERRILTTRPHGI